MGVRQKTGMHGWEMFNMQIALNVVEMFLL